MLDVPDLLVWVPPGAPKVVVPPLLLTIVALAAVLELLNVSVPSTSAMLELPAVLVSLNVIVAKEPAVVEMLALPALLELRKTTAPLLVMVEPPAVLLSWELKVAAAGLV